MHCLQAAWRMKAAIDPITAEAASGTTQSKSRLNSALRSRSARRSKITPLSAAIAANIDIAGSETGIPPHKLFRNSDEYGLISVSWQPSEPVGLLLDIPGMNEQCRLWTWRSRWAAKS